MPELNTSPYYTNLGGVNLKVSDYQLNKTEFLNLRNVDFDVPNALQKRPGSTQAISANTSGPIIGLFEYIKLDGSSWMIAGSNNALFYIASNALTVLDTGWTSGQPQDMLTFVNRLWVADGSRYRWWSGTGNTMLPAGLPTQRTFLDLATQWQAGDTAFSYETSSGATGFLVAGATMVTRGNSYVARGIYLAYSYVRNDGYEGPTDFRQNAKNIIRTLPTTTGDEFFGYSLGAGFAGMQILTGFTIPSGYGISAINIWIGIDSVQAGDTEEYITNGINLGSTIFSGNVAVGDLGWRWRVGGALHSFMSVTLKPGADLSLFRLFTSIAGSSFYTVTPADYPGFTLSSIGTTFGGWDSSGFGPGASAMSFGFWDTYTPKYIDVNQNVMFMSGFSNAPSTIWYSDVGEPEIIQPESNFEVRTNDGDRIIGHRYYNGNTIVFKTTSFHKIIGNNPDDFELVELSLEFGAVSNNAIIEFNEKLLFLDQKGIVQYDGAGWRVISNDIDDIFRSMNLSAAYEKAVGVHHNYRNQIWFGIPVNGSTENNLTVVWDYLIDAWTFFDGFNASSFTYSSSGLSQKTVWRGSPSGMIYYFGSSFYGDNGQGITCLTLSRFDKFVGENHTSVWRRLFVDVAPVSGLTGTLSGKVFSDYNQSTVKATFTMYQSQFQSRAEMGVVGKAMAFELTHRSASLPLLLNGYTWAKRNLRDV